jgi:hypothetical protein
MVRPINKVSIHLSLEEVLVRAGQEVLMEVEDNSALIFGDLQGILGQQLRARSIPLSSVMFMGILIRYESMS